MIAQTVCLDCGRVLSPGEDCIDCICNAEDANTALDAAEEMEEPAKE